jgi:PIN domain nuclease of toxin-antitoxin system
MNLLLDSHALLWSITGDLRVPAPVRAAIANPENRVFVSLASLWEIGIKLAQGRLHLPGNDIEYVLSFMERWRIEPLPVTLEHIRIAAALPFHHGDPFDRMLIAQANLEGLQLVSNDTKMRLYPVDLFW